VPDELIEAAQIDGASDVRIYWSIILPLILPAVATLAILTFQATWNSAETSTLFINTESLRTFAFYLTTLTATNATGANTVAGQGMAAAAALIMFAPNLLIFILLQSQVMNTMSHSGLK
jgi:ABC-type glycerol-3-phosphate transport system permease component